VSQRIAQQRLKDDPAAGQRRTDQGGGDDPRQTGDEEDLRVGVVGNGIERSKTRASEMCVDPISGPVSSAASSSRPKPISVTAIRLPDRRH